MPRVREDGTERRWVDDAAWCRLFQLSQAYLASLARRESPSAQAADAWAEFFTFCDSVIRRFMAGSHLRPQDCDDCVQKVWLELVKRLRDFQHEPQRHQFESWLFALVRSKVSDRVRELCGHGAGEITDEVELELAERASAQAKAQFERIQKQAMVTRALAELRHQVTTLSYCVLQRRWLKGQPFEKIAKRLHMTCDQVRYRDRLARQKLRDLFERDLQDGSEIDESQ